MTSTADQKPKEFEFKAEVKQLLDILIHSVYTSKDIFVRELVSNAADALERVRFLQVQGDSIANPELALEIRLEAKEDGDTPTMTISDTGIGMSEEEICTNLGTIAHSGAGAFLEQLKDTKDVSLIGRFGVGFYSVFMVADKVSITSRSAQPDVQPVRWTSDGLGSYSVEGAPEDTPRGTRIEIQLKKDEQRFANKETLQQVIRKYSNFIPFSIFVDGEQANQRTALWREQPHQVKEDQYGEFYKSISYDVEVPLQHLHLAVDVPLQFSALLFVPNSDPEALGFGQSEVGLQLYVKRVLIDGDNRNLLPKYFRFVRGVVESEDLPLNISRETLQENPLIAKIRDTLTKNLLEKFSDLAKNDPSKYETFWKAFGRILKEAYADFSHRDTIHELLRFNSSIHADADALCGLTDYVERMPEAQKDIYYLSGGSREALERDPHLEIFRKKEVEVLYLYDVSDEFVLNSVGKYREKNLVAAGTVSPDDLKNLGDQETVEGEKDKDGETTTSGEKAPDIRPLLTRFKQILGDRVGEVRPSERLVDSPACLVSGDKVSGHMEKMIRLMNKDASIPKRDLELNPDHALIHDLVALVGDKKGDSFLPLACEQIYEGALLLDGYLQDPHELVDRMLQTLGEAAALKKAAED